MQKKNKSNTFKDNFQELLNLVSDLIVVLNQEGIVLAANKATCTFLGLETEELIGKYFEDSKLFDEKTKMLIQRQLEKRLKGEVVENYEIPVLVNGETKYVEPRGNRIKYFGEPADLIIFHDITETRKVQKALMESEARYRQLVELAQEGICALDNNFNTVFVNPRMAQMLGYTESEIIGKSLFEFLDRDVTEQVKHFLTQFKHGIKGQFVHAFPRKDGTHIDTSIAASIITDDQGQPIGTLALVADITEQKRAEKALKESEELSRAIVANAPIGIATSDISYHFLSANEAFCRILGYREDELRKLTFKEITHPEDIQESIAKMAALEARRTSFLIQEKRYIKKDGKAIVGRVIVNAIRNPKGEPVLFIVKLEDITERKEAEADLRRLATVVTDSNDVVTVVDMEGRIIAWNKGAENTYGYRKDEALGMDFLKIVPEEEKQETLDVIGKIKMNETVGSFETKRLAKDGRVLDMWLTVTKLVDDEGNAVALATTERDITERKATEKEIRAGRERLESYLNSMVDGVCVTDRNGNFIQVNEATVKMHGFESHKELIGKPFLGVIARREVPRITREFTDAIKNRRLTLTNLEVDCLRKDGTEFPAVLNTKILWDKSRYLGAISVVRDITETKKDKQTIQDAREYVESIVATVREPLIVLDENLKVISASRSFYQTFQMASEETEGLHIYDVDNQQWNIPELRRLLEEILPDNSVFDDFEVDCFFPRIGRRVMLLNARRIRRETDHTQMILLTIEDITERKTLQEKLVTSEKLAAIGQLASAIGHEIRSPLGVIKNSAYFLNMRLKDAADEKVVKHLKILEKEVNSANLIISDLLDFARKKTPTLDQTDLNETVKNTLSIITVPENIRVEIKLGEIPKMLLDKEQVQRACQNLILNAVQAMPEGGKLTIQTTKQDDSAKLIVGDTGVGIPKENMPKLFTPLFSTKAKGIGLGLVICRQIVESHDGNITVESRVGEGSTFTVKLPIRTEKEISEQSAFTVPMPIEERVKIEK
jgi:PAS domain S-box-containing protein